MHEKSKQTARDRLRIGVVAALLGFSALAVCASVWMPLVLAAWFATILHPIVARLEHRLGGRRRAAGALVVIVALGVLVPLLGVVLALVPAVRGLFSQIRGAFQGDGSLASALLGDGSDATPSLSPFGADGSVDWTALARRYGADAWGALDTVASTSASVAFDVLLFVTALYTLVVDGERLYLWMAETLPVPQKALARLARAFVETGRGLLVAGVGTSLLQGLVATIAYWALGVPRPFLLGPLTAVCAIIPVVGTGLVWVPLAIELVLTDHVARGLGVVAIGVGAIGVVDNLARPFFARFGTLTLPPVLLLAAMAGGVPLFGATGALLGPLLVRLALEALAIAAEARRKHEPEPVDSTPPAPLESDETEVAS